MHTERQRIIIKILINPVRFLFCIILFPRVSARRLWFFRRKIKKRGNRSYRTEKRQLQLSPNKSYATLQRMQKGRMRFYRKIKTHSLTNVAYKICLASLLYHTFWQLLMLWTNKNSPTPFGIGDVCVINDKSYCRRWTRARCWWAEFHRLRSHRIRSWGF